MDFLEAIILGLVQGLTEFLPVSSSGHLVLAQELMDIHVPGIAFEVFVHFGTLLSVVVVYRQEILGLVRAAAGGFRNSGSLGEYYRDNRDFRLLVLILIGTLPAGITGILLGSPIEAAFNNVRMVAWMLIITGALLLCTTFVHPVEKDMSIKHGLLVGVAQAFAILPGISRSGSTISIALVMGIPREEAARFSFLLAIPVILGATLLKLADLFNDLPPVSELLGLLTGTVVAFASGYAAIRLLLVFIRRGKLDWFAWYCFAVGITGLLLF